MRHWAGLWRACHPGPEPPSIVNRLCVFCGSGTGVRPGYARAAEAMAAALVEQNSTLVYGGATVGLMGALADGVLRLGGEVIGVIPEGLFSSEVPHRGLTELRVVASMHERKKLMADLSDGFVAMPGGIGTVEELTEIFTWRQLNLHSKPVGILNVDAYFSKLLEFLDHVVAEGFMAQWRMDSLIVDTDPYSLVAKLGAAPSVAPSGDEGLQVPLGR